MSAVQYFIVAAVILGANGTGYLAGTLTTCPTPATKTEKAVIWTTRYAHRVVLIMVGILIAKGLLAL